MALHGPGSGIVGRKYVVQAVELPGHVFEVANPAVHILLWIARIHPQGSSSARHQLHKPHGSGRRNCLRVARRFRHHNSFDQALGYPVAGRLLPNHFFDFPVKQAGTGGWGGRRGGGAWLGRWRVKSPYYVAYSMIDFRNSLKAHVFLIGPFCRFPK